MPTPVRPTVADIDGDALAHNLACLRSRAQGAQVYGVVKANAYGHGMLSVSRRLEAEAVDGLCVALVEEGFALREAGIRCPVLVLNGVYGEDPEACLRAGLTPVLHRADQLQAFAALAGSEPVGVHLKLDTGMARLGIPEAQLASALDLLDALPLRLDGFMTHLSSADESPTATARQLAAFERGLALLRQRGHRPALVHASNSAGTYAALDGRYGMVRAGIALYGIPPVPGMGQELRPVMRLTSQIISLRQLAAGAPVGYGESYRARGPVRVATVPMGYGDGLLRAASNRAFMLVGGRRCPVVGRISMDLTCLDVSQLPEVALGDEVVVLGEQGQEAIAAEELAAWCGTIGYEVVTAISARVPRRYR